jgi:type I restriction enzyme M protein
MISLPLNLFYNTGIATYIWVLTNRKPDHRRGKVQLIDATSWFKPLRKNLGKKNCEFSPEDVERITTTFLAFEETEHSKVFANEAFGYSKVTVERPLRLKVDLSTSSFARFKKVCADASEESLARLVDRLKERLGDGPHTDFNAFIAELEKLAQRSGEKLTAKRQKLLQTSLAVKDEAAMPVVRKTYRQGRAEADPLHGRFAVALGGVSTVVEYEPDSDLRDTEQVPLLEEGGIEAFFCHEVLPYVQDAWIEETATKIGYEISFTRYFYRPQPLRTLEEIRADIEALERETEGLLGDVLVETGGTPMQEVRP